MSCNHKFRRYFQKFTTVVTRTLRSGACLLQVRYQRPRFIVTEFLNLHHLVLDQATSPFQLLIQILVFFDPSAIRFARGRGHSVVLYYHLTSIKVSLGTLGWQPQPLVQNVVGLSLTLLKSPKRLRKPDGSLNEERARKRYMIYI